MNPFGGLMQAVTGLVPGFGDKTGNIGKGIQGLPVNGDTILAADDNTRSFLAWVQNFMENADSVEFDGESVFKLQQVGIESDLPALDQLKALIADAMDQSADQPVVHSSNDQELDNGQAPLPQGIINAIVARHGRRDPADISSDETLATVAKEIVARENTPADGQPQAAGKDPLFQTAGPGNPSQAGQADDGQIKENSPAIGRLEPASSSIPIHAGEAYERPIKENAPAIGTLKPAASGIPYQAGYAKESTSDQVMKESRPEEGVEKRETRFSQKPADPAGDEGQSRTNRLIQERMPSGLGIAGKATDRTIPQLHPNAGQTKNPESLATGLAGQQSASPEDDTAGFRSKDPRHPVQRIELAEVKEEDWQKGQSSDSIKSGAVEQTRSQPSFQDTAKAMAGEPTTNTAVKPATGQAAVLTRTEDAAVKSFQTTVMDQIVDKASVRSIQGRSEIQIRLKPEFLGNVQMNIAADKEQLVVRIMTDRPVVKEIIETHLHHLKTELHSQGLTIDKFEVMVNPDANQQHSRDQFAQMFKHHSSQNSRQQPRGQDPETSDRDGGNNPDDGRPNRDGVNYFA